MRLYNSRFRGQSPKNNFVPERGGRSSSSFMENVVRIRIQISTFRVSNSVQVTTQKLMIMLDFCALFIHLKLSWTFLELVSLENPDLKVILFFIKKLVKASNNRVKSRSFDFNPFEVV